MVVLIFIRQSLDCLDGSVARACNKTSKLGAILDLSEDILTIIFLGGLMIWILWTNNIAPVWISLSATLVWLYGIFVFSRHLYGATVDIQIPMSLIEQYIHDNTVVLSMLLIWCAHSIIARVKN